uniref:Uncharacterized protein n=1 Tax=Lepeophtheirus salmonis TaxID=72036 RepID=A0A0K2SX27_LEPSM
MCKNSHRVYHIFPVSLLFLSLLSYLYHIHIFDLRNNKVVVLMKYYRRVFVASNIQHCFCLFFVIVLLWISSTLLSLLYHAAFPPKRNRKKVRNSLVVSQISQSYQLLFIS